MDAGRGRGRGRGRGVAAAGRGAAVAGAAGRGAAGAGRGAAGRGAAGRGAAGRGGRGAGRGLPQAEVSAESAAPSVATASVTQPVAGGVAGGVGGDAGVGVGAGAGAAPVGVVAPAQGDLIVGLLTQLLARLPQAVPQQAPVAPPAAGAQAGAGFEQHEAAGFGQHGAAGFQQQEAAGFGQQGAAGFVGQQGAAVGGLPAYREAMREMQRIGTPTFEGGVTPEQADEWRLRLERNFESVRCPEQFQVEIAVHYLGGDAHLWWRSVRTRREVWAWVDFVEEFNYRFFPQEARDRLQARFLELVQGERSVREYDAEFSRLLAYSGEILSERSLMGKFLRGLRQDIKGQCRGKLYHTRFELVELAASTEEDLRVPARAAVVPAAVASATQPRGQQQHQQRRNFGSGHGRGGRPQHGQKRRFDEFSRGGQGVQSGAQSAGCFGCGSLDHRVASCPRSASSRDTRACFHCGEQGHFRPNCPKLQQRTVGSVAAVQPLAIQSAAQVAALQPGPGGAPRVYSSAEVGQASQSGQITGIIFDPDFVNS